MSRFLIGPVTIVNDNTDIYLTEPVTVQEVKDYLQLVGTGYDGPLAIFITTARKQIENYCNVSLTAKIVRAQIRNTISSKPFPLPYSPIVSVTSLVWKRCRSTAVDQVYLTDWWFVDPDADQKWISSGRCTIDRNQGFIALYTTMPPADVTPFKQAILSQVGYIYNNRDSENAEQFSPETKGLIDSLRINYF